MARKSSHWLELYSNTADHFKCLNITHKFTVWIFHFEQSWGLHQRDVIISGLINLQQVKYNNWLNLCSHKRRRYGLLAAKRLGRSVRRILWERIIYEHNVSFTTHGPYSCHSLVTVHFISASSVIRQSWVPKWMVQKLVWMFQGNIQLRGHPWKS